MLIIKVIRAFFTGGITAIGACFGGYLANSFMNIAKDVGNYVFFDKENGWEKDHPNKKDVPVTEKLSTIMKEARSKSK